MVARTARLESGSPTPAAWLRSRFNCRALERVVRDPHVGERAEAGIDAVDGFVALGLPGDHRARRIDARTRGLGETDRPIVVSNRRDILERERLAIEEHHGWPVYQLESTVEPRPQSGRPEARIELSAGMRRSPCASCILHCAL